MKKVNSFTMCKNRENLKTYHNKLKSTQAPLTMQFKVPYESGQPNEHHTLVLKRAIKKELEKVTM